MKGLFSGTILLIIAVAVSSCADTDTHSRDDARATGVSVDNLPKWKLQEDLRIGELNRKDHILTVVSRLVVGGDGRIYAAQIREDLVRVYDSHGEFIATIGRGGQGPGEFGEMGVMGLRGDTLWVNDQRNRRVSLWSPEGRLLREFPHEVPSPVRELSTGRPFALLPDGKVLIIFGGGVIFEGFDKPVAPRDLLALASRENNLTDTLFSVAYPGIGVWYLSYMSGGERGNSYVTQPFQDTPLMRVSPDGERLIIVNREVATESEAGLIRLNIFDPTTRTKVTREYSYRPEPLRTATVDSIPRLRALSRPESSLAYRNARAFRERMFLPRFITPVSDVIAGGDGSLWLERTAPGRNWIVLAGGGAPLATVSLPMGFSLYHADTTHLWGYQENSDGIPQVVRYKLVK